MVPVLVVASFVVFGLSRLTAADPAITMAGGRQTSEAVLESIRQKYHLNEPVPVQYGLWASQALTGDLGESYRLKQPVAGLIGARIGVSLQLIAMSLFLSLATAIPLGTLAALRRDTWVDRLITVLALGGLSMPVFLTGILLILVFAYQLAWLPALGSGDGLIDNFRYLLLPACALALNMCALSLRITRNGMIDALSSNYVRTAIMKGLPRRVVVVRHALRNALVPLLTVSGLQLGFLLTGTVLVEYTFGIGGIGSLLINAIQASDYPVIQGVTLFVIAAFLLINLAVDLLYALVDPRIRLG
jgi:peptide/nickel transport system permease protein